MSADYILHLNFTDEQKEELRRLRMESDSRHRTMDGWLQSEIIPQAVAAFLENEEEDDE